MDTLVTVRADGGMSVINDCRSLLTELEACLSSHTAGSQTEIYNLSDKGAELHSMQSADGHEYLWQGDARYWEDRAVRP